jgi:hypothetical protein
MKNFMSIDLPCRFGPLARRKMLHLDMHVAELHEKNFLDAV